MKLSTKGRYAVRAMLELAVEYGNGPIMLREIARRQEISVRYLERMMAAMVAAGLVRSIRGQHGGFSLARRPTEITLSQVVRTVEGAITPVACVDDPELCHRSEVCVTREIWCDLKRAMEETLDSYTIADMVAMHYKKSGVPGKSPFSS